MRRLAFLTSICLSGPLLACASDDDPGAGTTNATFTTMGDETGDEETGDTGPAECGNGIVEDGEACDDGNEDDTDDCLSTCEEASCGDGFVQEGVEACDDQNDDDTDDCLSTCQVASCGDGFVQAGVEECDDQNDVDTDDCLTTCVAASCGDGFVQEGVETCDDQNDDDTDDCPSTCVAAFCGDGFVQNGVDQCDDGNDANDDGCDADCIPSGIVEVAAGSIHTCGLTRTGSVRCWGRSALGRLGYPAVGNVLPADTQSLVFPSPAVSITAGSSHTCVRLENGEAYCWGLGGDGRLGYGNTNDVGDDENAVDAGPIAIGQPIKQIEAGLSHTCAILMNDDILCWGQGTFGQLGNATTAAIGDDETPDAGTPVTPTDTVAQIGAGGGDHTCGWFNEAGLPYVKCWGPNTSGQLGTGTGTTEVIGDDELLTAGADTILHITDRPVLLAVGGNHSCAIMESKNVRCWGEGDNGRTGLQTTADIGDDEQPAQASVVDTGIQASDLAIGGEFSCAVSETGSVICWGAGDSGQLGNGATDDIGDDEAPSSSGVIAFPDEFFAVQVDAGNDHACAVGSAGDVVCWGVGANARLGYPGNQNVGDDETPADVGVVPMWPTPKMP